MAIADSDPDNLRLAAERFGLPNSAIYSDYEQMYATKCLTKSVRCLPVTCVTTTDHVSILAMLVAFHRLRDQSLDIVAPILPVQPNPAVVCRCARTPGLRAIACEKPICCTLAEADQMVDACRQHGVQFAAGDACRNYKQLWEAKDLINDGAIGEVSVMNLYESTDEISGGSER